MTEAGRLTHRHHPHLRGAAVLAADDAREGVGEAGGVGADERARLVHVGAQLEELQQK